VSNPAFEYYVTKAASKGDKTPACSIAARTFQRKRLCRFQDQIMLGGQIGCILLLRVCVGFQPLAKQLSKERDARTHIADPNFLILDSYVHE
jgi:hypothetical protein